MKRKYLSRFQKGLYRIILSLLFVGMVVNILMPDRKISYVENRSLSQFPSIKYEDILNGDFNKALTSWFSDQFVGRNTMIHLRYLIQKMTGHKDINGVYLTKKGLIEEIVEPKRNANERNIAAINDFYRLFSVPTTFLLAPNSATINDGALPRNASVRNQRKQIETFYKSLDEEIACIDLVDYFSSHKNEYLYYKTDHHWTSLGAYYGFQAFMDNRNIAVPDISEYTKYTVSDSFKGTLVNKTGAIGINDDVDIYVQKDLSNYLVTDLSDGAMKRTVYDSKGLETNNPYEVFFGGNHALLRIETENDSKDHLIVFKDSYANSFIPFLLPYYRTITIVDPRYYYYDDIVLMMEKYLITEVLYCYNGNTFFEDSSLADVIEYDHEKYLND